jgi:hypothetical protein
MLPAFARGFPRHPQKCARSRRSCSAHGRMESPQLIVRMEMAKYTPDICGISASSRQTWHKRFNSPHRQVVACPLPPPAHAALLLTKIWETGMQGARTSSCRPEIVERSGPQDAHLLPGSQMAWEILRRRADYRGQSCERRLLRTSPSLELIRTCRPLTSWGLCFRGRSGPDSTRRPPVLGGSGGHERHMRLGEPMSVH